MIALAVAFVCVTVLVLWNEAKPLLDRLLVVHERRNAPPAPSTPLPALPADIVHLAARWNDAHAQADVEARARELHAETGDWAQVRALLEQEMRA